MGLHTTRLDRAHALAEQLPVVRVLVNFAHAFGNGGGFDSGLEFTLFSGALKNKLGLVVVSEKTDRGRLYRISESRSDRVRGMRLGRGRDRRSLRANPGSNFKTQRRTVS